MAPDHLHSASDLNCGIAMTLAEADLLQGTIFLYCTPNGKFFWDIGLEGVYLVDAEKNLYALERIDSYPTDYGHIELAEHMEYSRSRKGLHIFGESINILHPMSWEEFVDFKTYIFVSGKGQLGSDTVVHPFL